MKLLKSGSICDDHKNIRLIKIILFVFTIFILLSPLYVSAESATDSSQTGSDSLSSDTSLSASENTTADEPLKILFIGDSRAVDMFSAKKHIIKGKVYNNITVYAKDAGNYDYMVKAIKQAGVKNYDVVVTWMGANDRGNFSQYKKYYKALKKKGIRLILCTVGYSDNNRLGDEGDILYYNNEIMKKFNSSLTKWAKNNNVETIDLYKYTLKHVEAQRNNGVHYVPKPTKKIWKYLLKKLKAKLGDF